MVLDVYGLANQDVIQPVIHPKIGASKRTPKSTQICRSDGE